MGDSTLDDIRRVEDGPAPRWGHRVGVAVLSLVVLSGALGVFGVHSGTTTADHDGYRLSVTYPQVARAGLDVPLRVRVHHDGGFSSDITLAITADYFRMFETQGFFPNADKTTGDGRFVYLTFTKPAGEDFLLDYDAYIQPSSQLGKAATMRLIISGTVVAETSFRTVLAP